MSNGISFFFSGEIAYVSKSNRWKIFNVLEFSFKENFSAYLFYSDIWLL